MNVIELISSYFDRTKSRLLTVYFAWLAIIHLPIIYTAIFIDQSLLYEKTGMLKNEYISDKYYNFPTGWFWMLYIVLATMVPALLTWLIIWILPKTVIKRAYERELIDQSDRDSIRIQKEAELEKLRTKVVKSQVETAENEQKAVVTKAETESIESKTWLTDYREFKASKYFTGFNEVIRSVYEYGGAVKESYNQFSNEYDFELKPSMLAYIDSLELVIFNKSDSRHDKIEFTNKGKFFVREYQKTKLYR